MSSLFTFTFPVPSQQSYKSRQGQTDKAIFLMKKLRHREDIQPGRVTHPVDSSSGHLWGGCPPPLVRPGSWGGDLGSSQQSRPPCLESQKPESPEEVVLQTVTDSSISRCPRIYRNMKQSMVTAPGAPAWP